MALLLRPCIIQSNKDTKMKMAWLLPSRKSKWRHLSKISHHKYEKKRYIKIIIDTKEEKHLVKNSINIIHKEMFRRKDKNKKTKEKEKNHDHLLNTSSLPGCFYQTWEPRLRKAECRD